MMLSKGFELAQRAGKHESEGDGKLAVQYLSASIDAFSSALVDLDGARRDLVRTEIANLKSRRELLESNSTRGSELERRMQSLQQPAALGAEDGDQLRRRLDKLNGLDGAVSATNGDDLLKRLEALTGKESHRPRWSTQGLDPEVAALMEQAQDEAFLL
ncbi:hypothetical protein BASA81_002265 [Batrachochytrium salamandrivorans]|nr:hypothetical protein BASA81_002265 [Batrachochytrium salamandrivorans]